jgi:branched-chain amino acid transport system substrate-binding protein
VAIDPATHHAILDVHLIEIRDQKMNVIESLAQRPPSDTQAVCDLMANPNDNKQYELKF